jgi:hypothetical protein
MLRTRALEVSLWEAVRPDEVRLPEELARVDAPLDDPVWAERAVAGGADAAGVNAAAHCAVPAVQPPSGRLRVHPTRPRAEGVAGCAVLSTTSPSCWPRPAESPNRPGNDCHRLRCPALLSLRTGDALRRVAGLRRCRRPEDRPSRRPREGPVEEGGHGGVERGRVVLVADIPGLGDGQVFQTVRDGQPDVAQHLTRWAELQRASPSP